MKFYIQEEIPCENPSVDTYLKVIPITGGNYRVEFKQMEFQKTAKISIYTTTEQDCKNVFVTFLGVRTLIQPVSQNVWEYKPSTYGKVRIEMFNSSGESIHDEIINVDEVKWWIIGDYPYSTEV